MKIVLKKSCLILIALFIGIVMCAQESDLKQKALEQFRKQNYPDAISLLKQALSENPDDAEIYYYLGYFSHYIVYDSRPFIKEGDKWSKEEVIKYLEKAVALNPQYGDAYYFLGAEYGARALEALRKGDIQQYRNEIINGHKANGLPDWLIEFGRNILKSCEENAILITIGDAQFNSLQYLQIIENYRKDVTVLAWGIFNRPWYVNLIKKGIPDILVNTPVSWTEDQIFDMHPYKWDTLTLEIPVSDEYIKKYFLSPKDSIMRWELKPDMSTKRGSYLSSGTALMANIIETNKWERPVFFTFGFSSSSLAGLDSYFQIHGLANKLLPFKTEETNFTYDINSTEKILLDPSSYEHFSDLKEHDMPRISPVFVYTYRNILFQLAQYYATKGNIQKAGNIISKMEKFLPETIYPIHPKFKEGIENFKNELKTSTKKKDGR
ncbi:MAG: hypothetical protein KAX05_02570 [Bacteroidales bacterium]|nr:hypothetical protein [Bacteroidales bacterium]